ncbi:MAG: DUF1559 family PulG-like putative transporter [Pirellulaceae bacterium]
MMSPVPMMGFSELLLIVLMGSGLGVPLGVPPQDPDPVLANVAPAECLFYSSWAGMAVPDATSTNQTEQLLAEPEVKAFIEELQAVAQRAVSKLGSRGGSGEQFLAQKIPVLAKAILTHGVTVFLESVQAGPNGLDAQGALVVNLGNDRPQIEAVLKSIRQQIPAQAIQEVEIEGHACVRLQPQPNSPAFTIGFDDQYLIAAMGDTSFEGVLQRAKQAPPGWLTQAQTEVHVPRPSTLAYANLEAIWKLAGGAGGPRAQSTLDSLGLTSITRAVSASGLDDTGFVSRTRVFTNAPDRGLLKVLAEKPLTAKDVAGIPRDASFALALRLDLAKVLQQGLEIGRELEATAANQFELQLSQVEQALGLELQKDLLQSLGDVWTVHAAPSGGGLLAGWTVAVDVRDKSRLAATHQKLLLIAQAQLAQGNAEHAPRIRMFECGGFTAYTLDVPDQNFYAAPSWCLTDTHLVVTAFPQALKSYLMQAAAKESLADQPDVSSLFSATNGPCSLSYQDTRGQFMTFYPWLQVGVQIVAKQLKKEGLDVNTAALPSTSAIAPHLLSSTSAAVKTAGGFEFVSHGTLPGASVGASAPVLVALLLPAVQGAREAARRSQSMNNLKQIALALHNYHDTFTAFPPAYSADKDGKPLLSWRVFILPYIEQTPLYQEFNLDEPWDSDHNKKLIARMPQIFRSPNSGAEPEKTVYLGNAGEDGVFVPPTGGAIKSGGTPQMPLGLSFAKISDGTSNTIMTVEANDGAAVIWTKPDDFVPAADNPLQGLTGMRPGGFLAGLCDGSVRFIAATIDKSTLKALFTCSGGEVVEFDY